MAQKAYSGSGARGIEVQIAMSQGFHLKLHKDIAKTKDCHHLHGKRTMGHVLLMTLRRTVVPAETSELDQGGHDSYYQVGWLSLLTTIPFCCVYHQFQVLVQFA